MLSAQFNNDEIKAALKTASEHSSDVKAISTATPKIVIEHNASAAHALICTPSKNRNAWLPEAFSLFNTPGLNSQQYKEMVNSVFGAENELNEHTIEQLSDITARMGRYGFSFPQWRFVSQGFAGPALVEHFGLQRQVRDNDVRDPDLPKFNPNRDQYGIGFSKQAGDWNIEYRRAYILCSNQTKGDTATIVIRNSSYFFGRDRLPAPVFVSWNALTSQELNALDENLLLNSGKFQQWQNILSDKINTPTSKQLNDLQTVLNFMDDFDTRLSLWLKSEGPVEQDTCFDALNTSFGQDGGLQHFISFLNFALTSHNAADRKGAPLYIAEINHHMPPWAPETSVPVTQALIDDLKTHNSELTSLNPNQLEQKKMILLSGPGGDFPLKPKPPQPTTQTLKPS